MGLLKAGVGALSRINGESIFTAMRSAPIF